MTRREKPVNVGQRAALFVALLGVVLGVVLGAQRLSVAEGDEGLFGRHGSPECGSAFSHRDFNIFLGDEPCRRAIDSRAGLVKGVIFGSIVVGIAGVVIFARAGSRSRAGNRAE